MAVKQNLNRSGADGEMVAAAHLQRLGWRILEQNFRCPAGEIDIIAEDHGQGDPVLVFVEVKARRGKNYGAPAEAVDAAKRLRIVAAAAGYLSQRNAGGAEPACRFDVVEVRIGADGLAGVNLIRAAFAADE